MTDKEVYQKGVALLEEWEDVNYCEHSFKFKDEWLTDREVVDLLNSLNDENEQLKFENNELKCALALDSIDYIIADGKKIDIPPYYEFENRYKNKKYRREEYDEYW